MTARDVHPMWCDLGPGCADGGSVHDGRATVSWPTRDDVKVSVSLRHSTDLRPDGQDTADTLVVVEMVNVAVVTAHGDRVAADAHLTTVEAEHLASVLLDYARRAQRTNDQGSTWWMPREDFSQ